MKTTTRRKVLRIATLLVVLTALDAGVLRAAVINNVTAKAKGEETATDRYARWAVNGVGLVGDAHTNAPNGHMWQDGVTNSWFRIHLNRECRIDTMRIWNYNEAAWTGRGVGLFDIYTSVNPGTNVPGTANWTLLLANQTLSQAPGLSTYSTPNTFTIDRTTLHVGLVIKGSLGGNRSGLSEVQLLGDALPTRAIANVTATASSSDPGQTPDKAVNGAGLVGEAHDKIGTNMWRPGGTVAWFKADLGKVCDIARMDVWNYNELGWPSRGVGTAHIYVATTDPGTNPGGAGWTQVKTSQVFNIAPGANGYDLPDRLILNQRARYVGISILTSLGGNRAGISEIKFYETPPPPGTTVLFR